MHLHKDLSVQTFPTKSIFNVQHGNFYDITSGALNRHVDRFALSRAANVGVAIVDSSQRTNPSIERTHIAMLARLRRDLIHVTAHAFVCRIVVIYYSARLLSRDADAL